MTTKGLKLFEVLPTEGTQICKACEQELPLEAFSVGERKKRWHPSTLKYRHGRCKPCMVQYVKQRKLCRMYGISLEDLNQMFVSQSGRCKLCNVEMHLGGKKRNRACIDHDHATGIVRGLLCFFCNAGLGMFEENVETMERAILYVQGRLPGTLALPATSTQEN